MQNLNEPKKNYMWIYIAVAVFYAAMIVVYSIVVHNATENGAQDVAPVVSSEAPEASKSLPVFGDMSLLATFEEAIKASPAIFHSD